LFDVGGEGVVMSNGTQLYKRSGLSQIVICKGMPRI